MPFRLNPHRSRTLHAVSFFEGFQTPAELEKTRARSCGRHLKPITNPDSGRILGAQPLYIQQRNLPIKALAMRIANPGGTPSTVSFEPSLPFQEVCQTGARGGLRTSR